MCRGDGPAFAPRVALFPLNPVGRPSSSPPLPSIHPGDFTAIKRWMFVCGYDGVLQHTNPNKGNGLHLVKRHAQL